MPRKTAGQVVEREFLTLPVWDRLDAATCEQVARSVERCLPDPWRFERVGRHELGDQRRHVAFFSWKKAEFALVPGAGAALGFDRRAAPRFTPAMEADWDETRGEYGLPPLAKYLAENCTKARTVTVPPLLVEAAPVEGYGVEDDDDPDELLRDGFRLPTADEWEYLCGGGARTLWRWGDGCPTDGYPYDYAHRPPLRKKFDRHRVPNAFGLTFPADGYQTEGVTGRRGRVVPRSGDGGGLTCGGAGFLAAWLLLATAFDPAPFCPDFYDVVRRVYPLPPQMFA